MEKAFEKASAGIDIAKEFEPAAHFDTIGKLVSVVAHNAFVLAGVIAFFLLILGGFGMIIGAGGDPKKMEQSKQTITGAVLGFIIIIGSFWIIQVLEILTGKTLLPK
jgi:hypothetical protein